MKNLVARAFATLLFATLAAPAVAQTDPGLVRGQIPSPADWNSYFDAKLDYNSGALTANSMTLASGITVGNGSASVPSVQFGAASGIGWYSDGTNIYGTVGGDETMELTSTGVVFLNLGSTGYVRTLRTDPTLTGPTEVGLFEGQGFNSTGVTQINWADVGLWARVTTTGSEEGNLTLQTFHGGTLQTDFSVDSGILYAGTVSSGHKIADASGNLFGLAVTATNTGAQAQFTGTRAEASLSTTTNVARLAGTANNSTGSLLSWGDVTIVASTPTAGSEIGAVNVQTMHGGSLTTDFSDTGGTFYAGTSSGQPVVTAAGAVVGIAAAPYSKQTPTTGFSITVGNAVNKLILTPAGTLATGTVTLPASPQDGQSVKIVSTQIVTSMTVSANAGQTITAPISASALAANTPVEWTYDLATTNWYRTG